MDCSTEEETIVRSDPEWWSMAHCPDKTGYKWLHQGPVLFNIFINDKSSGAGSGWEVVLSLCSALVTPCPDVNSSIQKRHRSVSLTYSRAPSHTAASLAAAAQPDPRVPASDSAP